MDQLFNPHDPALAQLVDGAEDPHLRRLRVRLALAEQDNLRLRRNLQALQKEFYRVCVWRDLWAWAFLFLLATVGVVGGLLWLLGWR